MILIYLIYIKCTYILLLNIIIIVIYVYNFSPKLRRVLRNAIDVGEKIFKKSNIISELACHVANNLGVAYPELRNNLKQVK